MARNHVQPGKVLDYVNTGGNIVSGQVVAVGNTLGVALEDILSGATGSVAIDGVFRVPKVSAAQILQGQSLVWDASEEAFDDNQATPQAGDISGPAALAFEDAGVGVTTLLVKFTGVPGTLAG